MTYDPRLPEKCLATNPGTDETIIIVRGERGYHPFPGKDARAYNARHGISDAVVEAMLIGSMFGWHVPGARYPE